MRPLNALRLLSAIVVVFLFRAAPLAAGDGFDQQDFTGSTNPWPGTSTYAYRGGGSSTASFAWGDFGLPVSPGGPASRGLRLTSNSANATGWWGAAIVSGRIATPALVGVSPDRIFLSLRLRSSSARPVLVRLESYNALGVSTGRAQTTLSASAAGTWGEYEIGLQTLTNIQGVFSPASPFLQLILEIGSDLNIGNWPAADNHTVDLEDVNIATLFRNTGFSAVDFSGITSPWPDASAEAPVGSLIPTTTRGTHGTIDAAGGTTPSLGLRLDADASAATSSWSAALTSGRLPPPAYGTTDPRLITLAFMLKASDARPILVRLESFNVSGTRTGRSETLIYPAAPDFWQRYALELFDFTPIDGTFDPAAHRLQLSLEIGSSSTAGNWPSTTGHWLQLDNVHLAGPAYYVRPASDGGSDSANGRSPSTALATIQRALNLAQPGDTILLLDGDYHPAHLASEVARFPRPGTPAAWITLKNHPGHTPVLRPTSWQGVRIRRGDQSAPAPVTQPALAYLEIRGLTIRGYSDTLPVAERGSNTGASNTDGISIDGRYDANLPHHIRVVGNNVSWCTGAGIGAIQADWIWVENNFVHDNCHWTIYATSGISLYQSTNYDGTSGGYRYLVSGNRLFRNETKVRWVATGRFSDGNGVIIDDSRNTQNRDKNPFPRDASTGRFLVAHNLAHDNGGSGLHAYVSDRVDFVHNTAWGNSRSPELRYRSLAANDSSDVRFLNNIVVASPDEPLAGSINQATNIVLIGNLFFGGNTPLDTVGVVTNTGNLSSNPLLATPAIGDLRLLPGSPALASAPATPLAGARAILRPTRDRGAWAELVPLAVDSPFAAWATVRDPSVTDPAADHDGDGVSNLLEYAFALDPLTPSVASLQPQISDTRLQINFLRARSDLIYTVEASSTLAPDGWTIIATDPGTVSTTVSVVVSDPNPGPRRFLRLRITQR